MKINVVRLRSALHEQNKDIVQHMELTIIILSIIKQRFQLIGEYYLGEIKDTSIHMLLQTCSIQRRMELVPICTKLHIALLPLDIAQMQT